MRHYLLGAKGVVTWTIETLHEHLIGRMNDADRLYQERFDSQRVALGKAEETAAAAVIRNTERINDVATRVQEMVTKSEVIAAVNRLDEHLRELSDRISALGDRVGSIESRSSGLRAGWGYIVTAFGMIGSVIATYYVLKHGG